MASLSPETGTVNFVVTDSPSTNVTVLSFQVQITGAVLQPGNVSILPRPVTVDLAQLVSDTGFLASAVIGSATYTSLELTFANPQVTIQNNTNATLMPAGQSCAPGIICTFTPALNNASLTISNGVFPLTVTASSSTGLNLDLSIPDLLQSDLSVTLANGTSANLSLLPGTQEARVDDVLASITSVGSGQVSVTTAFGDSLVLVSNSSTRYSYPSAVCATADASCLAAGQIVTADLSLTGAGSLTINSISYLGNSGSPLVKGLILSTDTAAATPSMRVLLQRGVNASSLGAGEVATVSLPADTLYAVGSAVYPQTAGVSFAGPTDLLPGQEVVLGVGMDLVAGTSPAFSAGAVYLEASQVIGEVTAVNPAGSSLQLDGLSGLFSGSRPIIQEMDVQTDSTTQFVGFTPGSLGGVTAGQAIVVKGPLFTSTASSYPAVAAIQVRTRQY